MKRRDKRTQPERLVFSQGYHTFENYTDTGHATGRHFSMKLSQFKDFAKICAEFGHQFVPVKTKRFGWARVCVSCMKLVTHDN